MTGEAITHAVRVLGGAGAVLSCGRSPLGEPWNAVLRNRRGRIVRAFGGQTPSAPVRALLVAAAEKLSEGETT